MSRYKVKLESILDLIAEGNYTLTGSYGEDNDVDIWSHSQLVNTIGYFYAERSILVPSAIAKDDTTAQEAYFKGLFNLFKSENADNLARAFLAIQAEYNPIENYNGTETITTVHGKKSETEYNTSDDLTHGLTVNSSSDVYGYNSSDPVPDSKAEVVNSGTDSNAKTGTVTETDSGTDTVTNIKAGNIGVTTNQQMINEEIALRFHNLTYKAIGMFLNPITIY